MILSLLGFSTAGWSLLNVQPFLAETDRVNTDVLIVEGWVHEYAIRGAVEEFKRGSYERVFTTGGPVTGRGRYINDYQTSASVGADLLKERRSATGCCANGSVTRNGSGQNIRFRCCPARVVPQPQHGCAQRECCDRKCRMPDGRASYLRKLWGRMSQLASSPCRIRIMIRAVGGCTAKASKTLGAKPSRSLCAPVLSSFGTAARRESRLSLWRKHQTMKVAIVGFGVCWVAPSDAVCEYEGYGSRPRR